MTSTNLISATAIVSGSIVANSISGRVSSVIRWVWGLRGGLYVGYGTGKHYPSTTASYVAGWRGAVSWLGAAAQKEDVLVIRARTPKTIQEQAFYAGWHAALAAARNLSGLVARG